MTDLKFEAEKLHGTQPHKIILAILEDIRTKPAQFVQNTSDLTINLAHRLDAENDIIYNIINYFEPQ